jgi:TP901 family phage tail tape measure protein
MAGNINATIAVDLDLVLGNLDDDQLIKQLAKMGDAVASSVAKVSIDPDVKVDAQKMLEKVNQQILTAAPKSGSAEKVVATYTKLFKDVGTALSAVGADLPAKQAKLFRDRVSAIAAGDADVLSNLDAQKKEEAVRFVKAAEGRDNLVRQALKSSESIRNDTGGKERDPLLPIINPETKRQLDENLATYRKFYKAIGDTSEAARVKEEQNQVYRRNLLDPFLIEGASTKNLDEKFSFAGHRRAIAGEVRRLNQDLDRAAPEDRKPIQDEVDKLENLRRALGNRFRELFGSTLGRGLEASKGQRDEALGEYRKRIEQYQNPELDRDTRLASLTSAKRELTRSLATAYAAQRATQDPAEKEDARLNVLGLERRMRTLTGILEVEREQGAELRRNTKDERDRLKWANGKAAAEARALEAMRQMSQLPVGSRGYTQARAEATDAAATAKTLAKKLGEQSPGALPADVRFLAKKLGDSERATGKVATKASQQAQLEATLKRAGAQTNAALDALKRVEFGSIDFEKQLARAKSAAGEYTSAAKRLGRTDATDFKAYVDEKIKDVQQQGKQTGSQQKFAEVLAETQRLYASFKTQAKGTEGYTQSDIRLRDSLSSLGRLGKSLKGESYDQFVTELGKYRSANAEESDKNREARRRDRLWQVQVSRNQLQDATLTAIQSARQKQSKTGVYPSRMGGFSASNESVLAGLHRVEAGTWSGPEKDVGALILSGIDRQRDGKKGRSSDVLKAITEWADRNNERIILNAKASGDLPQEDLVKWYERNGFVTRKDGAMERTPRPPSAADLKRIKVEELGSEVGRDLRIITKGTAKPAALDKAARILRLNMGRLRTEAAKQGGEILREFADLETEVKQALDTLAIKGTRKELAAAIRKYRAERDIIRSAEFGSPEYKNALRKSNEAARRVKSLREGSDIGTIAPDRLLDDRTKVMERAKARSKAVPAEDFSSHVGIYRTRQTRIEALGTARDALSTQVSSLRSLMGNAQTEGDIKTLRILLAEALADVRHLGTESKKLGFEEGIDSARRLKKEISEVGDVSKTTLKEIKGPTAAELRRAEKERIRQALIDEGQAAFEDVGGYKNYARIPKEQYRPALEAAKDREASILSRFATVRDDTTLAPGIKKQQLRELTVEFNHVSRAAKVLQQEINGNVGFLRQLSLAARNFARYFLFYGGMYQIIGYFTQMTRALVDFQDSLKQTQVIAQATNDDMVSIGGTIRDVSRNTGQSLQAVSDAAQTLAQAGVDVQSIPAALEAVSNFAMATGSNLQVASDVIASAKEIFDKDLTFLGASDQLTRAINISKLKAEDLKTIFNLGAQTAQTSGLTSAQFLGASATLSNLGIKSSTVATGLRQLLLEIFNPDEKTLQFLRKRYNQIGENLTDQEIRNRFSEFEKGSNPLVAALTELKRLGAAGSAQEDFRRVLDIRAENVGLPLMRRLDELVRNISRVSETGGAERGAVDRMDTLKKSFERLGTSAQLLGETFLDIVDGPLKGAADYLSQTIDRIGQYSEKLGREGRSPVAGVEDAVTGGLGGFVAGKLLGFGKFGTALTAIFGALADLAQAKILEGTGKEVVGKAITWLTALFSIFGLFGKKKVVGVPESPGQGIAQVGIFAESISKLWGWIAKAFPGGALTRLTGAVSRLLSFAPGGPVAWLAAIAYSAYELFDWFRKDETKGTPSLDVARRDAAKAVKARDKLLEEQKSYDSTVKGSQSDQLNEGLAQAEKYKQTLNDMFGEKSGQVAKMFAELGSTSLESSTEVAKKFKARIEQEVLPKGKQLTARQFSRLIEAQSAMLQAQGLIATQQEKLTRDAVQIMKDTGGKLNAEQEKIVSAAEALNRDPVFGPNGFNPQSLVDKVLTLFQTLDLFVRDNSAKVDAASAQVKGPQQQIVDAEVQSMPERQMDLEVQGILSNPSKEGLERLKQLREGYRKAYIDPLENDPVRRAEPGKPVDTQKAKALEDQIAQKEARLKQFDEQVKQAEAGVAEKDKRVEEEKAAKADQAKADELRKADAAKKAAEIAEKEVALLDMRLKAKNLEDQWETEYAAARKAQNWDSLLKEKGLIDQTAAAKAQVARTEQEIAELTLRKLADEKGILDLPSDLSKVTAEQKKLFLGDADVRSAYEGYLDKTQAVTEATEEGKKRRRTIFEESKQIVPFVEGDAYRDRDNKIRDLNTQIRRVQTQGSEEHLALERQKFDLQKTQLEEQIAHLQSQEGNYKRNEKGQGQYRAAMDDLQNKLKDLQDDYDEKVIRANKELRIKDADARVKKAREELEYIRKQRDLVGQGPTSTRMQTIQIRGQAPATTPSYPGAPRYPTPYDDLFSKFETQYGIPSGLLKAIAHVETGGKFDPRAVNPTSGAQGLMQIMPAMQRRLKVSDPFDAEQSIKGGAENLKWLLGYYKGDTDKAIMAYNTSFRNVDKGKIPSETRNYLPKVKEAWQQGEASPARASPAFRPRSWDEFKFIDQNGDFAGDVTGLDKFKQNAPQVYQAIIGGAMKWVEEQGGQAKVVIKDLGRGKGDKGNHSMGAAGDIQLIDKNGRPIDNYQPGGKDFRAYEKFWQDGMAYAMQMYGPEMEKYFRFGGYFSSTGPGAKPGDVMHGDVSMLYNEERKRLGKKPAVMPGGGTLRGGANDTLKALFPTIVSEGIPNGDWDQYFRDRFPQLAGSMVQGGAGPTVNLPVFSDQFRPQSDLERIQDLTYREERAIDNYRRALLDQNRERGGGKAGEAAVYEQVGNEVSSSIRAQQETTVDNLRSKLQQQQVRLEQQQARGLRSGPADTAAREAAGLAAAPQDAYEMLIDLEAVLLDLRDQAQKNLKDAEEALATDKGVAAQLERDLQDPNLSEKERGLLQKALDEKLNNVKAYDAAIIEFKRNINETDRGLGANRQQQQDVKPTFTGKEYPDGSRTYGQLEQGFDFKAIAGQLNDLSYSLKNLGRNIRGFIVGAVDTFVSTIADKLVKGAENVDTAALNQARADLYQAQGDASYNLAQQKKDLAAAESAASQMPGNAGARARHAEAQVAYAESSRSYGEAVNARKQQVKDLEQQQNQGMGDALQEAFTRLSQDFASQMLKTILLSPFQAIFDKLGFGQRGSSSNNPLFVKDVDSKATPATPGQEGGGVLGSDKGGVIDSVLGPLEGIFYKIGNGFGSIFNSVMGALGSLGGGGGSSWVGSAIGAVGSLMGFAEGGQVKGPGTGTSDSIPAWLSNGEYVLTASEVQKIGVQNIEKWKSAMASPAKFATGGLVQTFDSASRNPANYGNAGVTGGNTDVTIIDQRSQASSEPVSVNRTRGPDNKETIQIMVRDAVKNAINSGAMDRTMAANYGARRPGARR